MRLFRVILLQDRLDTKEEDDRTIEIDNLVFKEVKNKRIDKVKLYIISRDTSSDD